MAARWGSHDVGLQAASPAALPAVVREALSASPNQHDVAYWSSSLLVGCRSARSASLLSSYFLLLQQGACIASSAQLANLPCITLVFTDLQLACGDLSVAHWQGLPVLAHKFCPVAFPPAISTGLHILSLAWHAGCSLLGLFSHMWAAAHL